MNRALLDNSLKILNYMILGLVVVITFYPFYYILIYSLSSPFEAIKGVYFLPRGITVNNFLEVLKRNSIASSVLVSLSRAALGSLLTVICSSIFAYGISKRFVPFRRTIYLLLVISMYFSPGLIPWYMTMKAYGLKNNFLLYILPWAVVPFFVILFKTSFEQLPQEIEESALFDGASYFKAYWYIIMPLSTPVIATIALFQAVGQWNYWIDNLFLCSSKSLLTLQLLLLSFLNEAAAISNAGLTNSELGARTMTSTAVRMTITIIALVPISLIYPFAQRYFVKGILIGAVKG